MKKNNQNKQWFSIVIAIFMIGFLLVLTTGVFNLVLREMKDSRWSENYLKAYAGAEWAMELWLLNIKENWYATDKDLASTDIGSKSLTFTWSFKAQSDPLISYTTDIAVNSFSWSLESWETVIIPLFVNTVWITKPNLTADTDIIWNIIGAWEWMSWNGDFNMTTSQVYKKNDWKYTSWAKTVQYFLKPSPSWAGNTNSYLMLFNKWVVGKDYILGAGLWELFSKPVWNITSTVTVWKYKQNISTSINNTEFLNMLKYSLYSN